MASKRSLFLSNTEMKQANCNESFFKPTINKKATRQVKNESNTEFKPLRKSPKPAEPQPSIPKDTSTTTTKGSQNIINIQSNTTEMIHQEESVVVWTSVLTNQKPSM